MDIVTQFRKLFNAGWIEATELALVSMDEANVDLKDLASCLRTGVLQRSSPKEPKHEILGFTQDGRRIRVVARLTKSKRMRTLMVYED